MLKTCARRRAALLVAIVFLGVACDEKSTPSDSSGVPGGSEGSSVLRGVPPFDQLADVQLNMTAGRLQQVRPGVRNAAYYGLQDSIDGYRVDFEFPGNVRDDIDTPIGDRLASVRAGRTFASDAQGAAAYRSTIQRLRATLEAPAECFSVTPGRNVVHYARWAVADTTIYVHYTTADGLPGSKTALAEPARVSTVMSRNDLSIPSRLTRKPEPCPANT